MDIEAWMVGARDEESVIESISGRWERKGKGNTRTATAFGLSVSFGLSR